MEVGRSAGDPSDEFGDMGVGFERFDRRVAAGELGFRERGVDFIMTDLMQERGRAAASASGFRDEMMEALACLWRDRAATERADRVLELSRRWVRHAGVQN